ncbi:hypothetical protein PTKIN_Ptkin06aG0115600 [Pterospermum kingtungense]
MCTFSRDGSLLPLLTISTGSGSGGESSSSDNNKQQNAPTGSGSVHTMPKKAIDTFGQRTSIYRGVSRHRWTGRYEAHLWDNSCRRGQTLREEKVYFFLFLYYIFLSVNHFLI